MIIPSLIDDVHESNYLAYCSPTAESVDGRGRRRRKMKVINLHVYIDDLYTGKKRSTNE